MIYHIEADEHIKKLIKATFPDYRGRRFKLHVSDAPINCASYWDGGSRSLYRFVKLDTLECTLEMPAQDRFDVKVAGLDCVLLPPGYACIEHSMFMGKDNGITIHIPPESAATLLPPPIELTLPEKIVLVATRGLKPTYNGVKDFRYCEAHIQTCIWRTEWDEATMSLMNGDLLDRRGAIMPKGCNAISNEHSMFQLKIVRES